MTDADVIEATRRGDREAFALLIERYERMVAGVAFTVTGRRALVDDLVQDTFVAAWRDVHRLRDPASARAWLRGIAKNLAHKARRRRRDEPLAEPATTRTPFDDASERELDREVARALAALPARYREPVVMVYFEHATVKEVAAALSLREDAVMQRLSRARRRLGEALEAHVEQVVDSRAARTAIVAWILARLPAREAHAAAASTAWWRYWRAPAAVVACVAAGIGVRAGVAKSEQIAAHARPVKPHPPVPPPPPALPRSEMPAQVFHNTAIASPDAADSCARGAQGLASGIFRREATRIENGVELYDPSPALRQQIHAIAERAAANCGDGPWPEIYVVCEGTRADIIAGNITCYPYNPFAT